MTTQNEIQHQGQQNGAHEGSPVRFSGTDATLRPSVDIFETPDDITVHADMPGVSRDRLDIRVEGTSLFLEGRVGIEPQQQMAPLYADVRATTYRRSFLLGNELEADKIEATLKDGVLVLRIPKRAEVRPRRIEVKG
jgi:HSP20 family molecular chaperone IbpA